MAAGVDAATTHASENAVFCLFNKCLSESLSCSSRLYASDYKYSQQALLDICKSKINNILDTTTETNIKELGLLRQPVITTDLTAGPDPTATTALIKTSETLCEEAEEGQALRYPS